MKISKLIVFAGVALLSTATIFSAAAAAETGRNRPAGTTKYHKKPLYTEKSRNGHFNSRPGADYYRRYRNPWMIRPYGYDRRFFIQRRQFPEDRKGRRDVSPYGSTYHTHSPERRPHR